MSHLPTVRISQTPVSTATTSSDSLSTGIGPSMNVLIPVSNISNNTAIAVLPMLNSTGTVRSNTAVSSHPFSSVPVTSVTVNSVANVHLQPLTTHNSNILNNVVTPAPRTIPMQIDATNISNTISASSVNPSQLHSGISFTTMPPIGSSNATPIVGPTTPNTLINATRMPITNTVRPIALHPYLGHEPLSTEAAVINTRPIVVNPSTPSTPSAPRVGMDEALHFLEVLKQYYAENSPQNQEFMGIMKDFQDKKITTAAVVDRVYQLFGDKPELLERFSTFLPNTVTSPIAVDANSIGTIRSGGATPRAIVNPTVSNRNISVTPTPLHPSNSIPPTPVSIGACANNLLPGLASSAIAGVAHEVVDDENLQTAMDFVVSVINRFTNQPDRYNQFIEILRQCNSLLTESNDHAAHREANVHVRRSVRKLFEGEADLIQGFDQFLRQTTSSHFAATNASDSCCSRSPISCLGDVPGTRRNLMGEITEANLTQHQSRGGGATKRGCVLPNDPGGNRPLSVVRVGGTTGGLSETPGRQRTLSNGSVGGGGSVNNSSAQMRSNNYSLRNVVQELTRSVEGTGHEIAFNDCLKQWQEEVVNDSSFVHRLQFLVSNNAANISPLKLQQIGRSIHRIANNLHVTPPSFPFPILRSGEDVLPSDTYPIRDPYEEGSDILDDDDDADDQVLLEEDDGDDDDYIEDTRVNINEEQIIDEDTEMREILESTTTKHIIPVLPSEEVDDSLRFLPINSRPALGRQRQNSSIITPVREKTPIIGKNAQRRRRRGISTNVDGLPSTKPSKRARIVGGMPSPNIPSSGEDNDSSLLGVSSDEDMRPTASTAPETRRPPRVSNVTVDRIPKRANANNTKEEPFSDTDEQTRRSGMNDTLPQQPPIFRQTSSRERCCKSYRRLRPNERPPPSTDPIGSQVLNTEYMCSARVAGQVFNEEEEANETDDSSSDTAPNLEHQKTEPRETTLTTGKLPVMGSGRRKRRHQQPQPWPHQKVTSRVSTLTGIHSTIPAMLHTSVLTHQQLDENGRGNVGISPVSAALLRSPTAVTGRFTGAGGGASPQEHLFQVEDERYEMDNVVDMNVYALQELSALRQRIIAQPDAPDFKPMNFKLEKAVKYSFLTVYRAIQRLYGEKVDTIIHLLSDCPCKGLDVIISRMEQKHREWSYVRRFFQRGWYQKTITWYYRALDVYGYSNKPKQDDVTQFRNKALVDEVLLDARQSMRLDESENQYNRNLSASNEVVHVYTHQSTPCPSFDATSSNPLNDAVDLVVHNVKRLVNTYKEDKSVMKRIMRCILPQLLNAQPLPMSEDEPDDETEEEKGPEMKKKSPIDKSLSDAARDSLLASSAAHDPCEKGFTATNLKNGTSQCWWQSGAIDEKRFSHIRHALFEIPERRSRFRHLDLDAYLRVENEMGLKFNLFYANDNWLMIIRLFLILCNRLSHFSRLSKQLHRDEVAQKLKRTKNGTEDTLHLLLGVPPPDCVFEDRYQEFLKVFSDYIDGGLDNNIAYEDKLRELFGTQAYPLFSLDKLISNIVRQLQQCVGSNAGLALLTLYQQYSRQAKLISSATNSVNDFALERTYEQLSMLICNCPGLLNTSPSGEVSSSENEFSSVCTTDQLPEGDNQKKKLKGDVPGVAGVQSTSVPPLAPFLTSDMLGDIRQQIDCFRLIFIPQRLCLWMQVLDRITPTIVDDEYAELQRTLKMQYKTLGQKACIIDTLPQSLGDKAVHTWHDYLLAYVHHGMSDDSVPNTDNINQPISATPQSVSQEFVARCLFSKLKDVPLFRVRTVRRVVQRMATNLRHEKKLNAVSENEDEKDSVLMKLIESPDTKVKDEPNTSESDVGESEKRIHQCNMSLSNIADSSMEDKEPMNLVVQTNGLKRDTCFLAKVIFRIDLQPEQVFHNTLCTERRYERDWSAARTPWSNDSYGVLIRARNSNKLLTLRKEGFQAMHNRWKALNNVSDATSIGFFDQS